MGPSVGKDDTATLAQLGTQSKSVPKLDIWNDDTWGDVSPTTVPSPAVAPSPTVAPSPAVAPSPVAPSPAADSQVTPSSGLCAASHLCANQEVASRAVSLPTVDQQHV